LVLEKQMPMMEEWQGDERKNEKMLPFTGSLTYRDIQRERELRGLCVVWMIVCVREREIGERKEGSRDEEEGKKVEGGGGQKRLFE